MFVLVDIFSMTMNTSKQKAALFYKVCQNCLTFSTIQKNVWSLNQRTSKFQNKSDPTALKGASTALHGAQRVERTSFGANWRGMNFIARIGNDGTSFIVHFL